MSRLRDERGITLMEVLSAATVGFVVLAGVFGLLESSVRLNTGVLAKTDAMQRGRIADGQAHAAAALAGVPGPRQPGGPRGRDRHLDDVLRRLQQGGRVQAA